MNRPRLRRFLLPGAVAALLAMIFLQLVLMASRNSATWDEPDHIYSAYMQAKHGDFGLNPEHPPLIKFLGALPLLDMQFKMPPLQGRPYRLEEAVGGREFLFGNDANAILFRVRLATSSITILLAMLVFLAAQEMFATGAGFIALGLIAFDPTLLAHSALLTTDAGGACFLFASVYAFYRYAGSPSKARLVLVGLVAGLALASKHSSVLLFPMLVLLSLVEVVWTQAPRRKRALQLAGALVAVALLSVGVLWASYGFRYAARVDGLQLNPTVAAQFARVPSHAEGTVLAAVAKLHLLPESYLYGFAHVLVQSKAFASFLLGTIYPHPVWFYFPVAMVIKSTLTFLILFAITVWAIASGRLRARREILYMALPAAIYMAFAMAGGMNIGVRHVLPTYVFLSVLIAGAAWRLIERDRRWLYAVVALLVFHAVSVVHAFPAYISYANEAAGGPSAVHSLLSDSSSDWGQQLKAVKRYTDEHGIRDCWFAYFGQGVVDYSYYAIPCKPLITADSLHFDGPRDVPPSIDGPVFMSAGVLSGFEFGPGALNPYEQFKRLEPAAVIDYGVFVYQGHFDIPLAAALSHGQKAGLLLAQEKLPEALSEAQQAEALAPDSAVVNATLGRALDASGRQQEALPFYQKALMLAQTVEPRFQERLIKAMEQRLASASGKRAG
ncbi:MAG TPA: glycosyltransferase family 39 protein [Bryobacteraceae bacterium]|nr:glycosyltransferase family 39 protein [Bryobacteraceae bacterium]